MAQGTVFSFLPSFTLYEIYIFGDGENIFKRKYVPETKPGKGEGGGDCNDSFHNIQMFCIYFMWFLIIFSIIFL